MSDSDIQNDLATSKTGATMLARDQLPATLQLWRQPLVTDDDDYQEAENAVWEPLQPLFEERGYKLWVYNFGSLFSPGPEESAEVSSGFAYASPHRGGGEVPGSVWDIFEFLSMNALCRPARTKEGRDVVIRVLAVGHRGSDHADILRTIARGCLAFYSNNHTIPLLDTVEFEDITFGIFPKVGFRVEEAYGYWAKNSVGDIVDMLRQCLEDAFKDNFLVQWHPESLLAGHPAHSMPRVYLTDFEVAILFPQSATYEDCVASGIPMGGSFPDDPTRYKRPVPPDVASGETYNAMKLDVWQLAKSFENFQSTIPEIDKLLECMRDPDSARRPDSALALSDLTDILSAIPLKSLHIPPVLLNNGPCSIAV
ncbi:hypothetical protein BN946_scf184895.g5 [Trametes cinnabarina]|uniref:Protein kinase domain-containing protein n=1 Tax=Pycnoporus cinnabarinus TaxID=5643 RepID=A0A060SLE9_PYCCI|nr:hypothetical protein BN946_scf184895.g5 [Trametes cinnabarina]